MTEQVDFKVLSEREHCLHRPGVFIGSTEPESYETFISGKWTNRFYSQGLAKIINEIIDNSVDEHIRTSFAHAKNITINITKNSCEITDDGRGIPQDMIAMPTGGSVERPVAAWTQLRAGSNFDDSKRIGGGTNGVGGALCNIFSTHFKGVTCDGNNALIVTSTNNMSTIDVKKRLTPNQKTGTNVKFTPDFKRFGVVEFDQDIIDVIKNRVELLQVCYPTIKFKFNKAIIKTNNIKKYSALYSEHSITQHHENVSWFIANSADHTFRQVSAVNGLYNSQGGAHVNWFMNSLCKELSPMIKRKFKIDVPNSAIKNGLVLGILLQGFNSPEFDSQTKERFKSSETKIKQHCSNIVDFIKIAKQLLKNDDLIKPIIDVYLARKDADDLRQAAKAAKANKRQARVEGHIKAQKKGGNFFLMEGLSASGYLISVRDKDIHGGLPLKGKVMNIHSASIKEILANKEYANIMGCMGLDLSTTNACLDLHKDFYSVGDNILNLNDELFYKDKWVFCADIREKKSLSKPDMTIYDAQDNAKVRRQTTMYYNEVHILTDADTDGVGSIAPGVLNFFWKWPDLFKNGRIKIVRSPIIIAKNVKGKVDDWFYDLTSYHATTKKFASVRYIKGLGSLTKSEYKKVINDCPRYKININDPKEFDLLYLKGRIAGSKNATDTWENKRKEWMID